MATKLPSFRHFVAELQDLRIIDECIVPAHVQVASETSRVLILAGSNGTGKSLLVSVLGAWLQEAEIEPITVSMKRRTGGGIASAFMFGDEGTQSTGIISVQTARTGILTALSREKNHVLTFDEPDIGLSAEYAGAFGELLGGFAAAPGPHTVGYVVVSHSRPLLRSLLACCPEQPHFINMDNQLSLQDWLDNPQERSLAELLTLRDQAHARFRALGSLKA